MPPADLPADPPPGEPARSGEAARSGEVPGLVLRAPSAADLPALIAIDAGWQPEGRARRAYLHARLARALRPEGVSLARVAERRGEVVGFVLGEVTRGEFGRVQAVAWLDTIGVRRDATRAGVGAALVEDFLSHARAIGAESVRTLIDPDDEALTGLLDASGFRLARTRLVERPLR